ncbi:hypothetical protein JOM56_007183 [Amanita muscaria]
MEPFIGVVVRSLGTPTIAQASVSIEEYLKRLCLEDGALDGPLSDHDWSDNEKQAFYGPLSECEASDAEDGMPQSKVAPIEDCLQKHLQNKALDGPLSDRDRSDDEEQAFYGPLRECEVSDTEDGMPQSKGAPIEDFLQKHLQNKALDCPLSDHDRSDDEEQAFYGPLSECEASEIGDSLPQSKDAHAIKKLEHWKRQLVRKREKRRKNRKRQQEDRGTGMKDVVYKKRRVEATKEAFQLNFDVGSDVECTESGWLGKVLQPIYTQSYTRQNKERSSWRATKRQEVSELRLYFHQSDEPSTTMVLLS